MSSKFSNKVLECKYYRHDGITLRIGDAIQHKHLSPTTIRRFEKTPMGDVIVRYEPVVSFNAEGGWDYVRPLVAMIKQNSVFYESCVGKPKSSSHTVQIATLKEEIFWLKNENAKLREKLEKVRGIVND